MYLSVDADGTFESTRDEAQFLLYDIMPNVSLNGTYNIAQGESSTTLQCIYYKKLKCTACYISNEVDLRTLSRISMTKMSRIQYGPDLFPYGINNPAEILDFVFYTNNKINKYIIMYKNYPLLQNIFKTQQINRVSISASHLRHISIKELCNLGLDYFREKAWFVLPMLENLAKHNLHESMLAGVLLWACSLNDKSRNRAETSQIWQWKFDSVQEWAIKIKKDFSLRLKALQNLLYMDLSQFFELEVLVNRGIGEVNWQQEKENRTNVKLAEFKTQDIFKECLKLFSQCKNLGAKPKFNNWTPFFMKRWQWAPTGSIHSQYEEDKKYFSKSRSLRNKLFSFSKMENKNLDHFLSRQPSTHAWPSVKYEWGKQRAIYGVDLTNFVLCCFSMDGCEEVLEKKFPIGKQAEDQQVKTNVKEILRNGVPFCYDFEDFNSQHSIQAMQQVLLAYGAIFKDSISEEQLETIAWMVESFKYTTIHGEDGNYNAKGTLMSGHRLTTFINTVLNYVYIQIMNQNDELVSTHNGDDVLSAVQRFKQIQKLNQNAIKHKVRFQNKKCFLGAIAEFLRVDHKQGNGAQYLARACSTFVHGPVETMIPNDLTAILRSNLTRKQELLQRGANSDVVEQFYQQQNIAISNIWKIDIEDIIKIQNTHECFGGISKILNQETQQYDIQVVEVNREQKDKDIQDLKTDFKGAKDYANYLCKNLLDMKYYDKVYKKIKQAILSSSVTKQFKVQIKKQHETNERYLHANQLGMFKKTQSSVKFDLAKAFGIPLVDVKVHGGFLESILLYEEDKLKVLNLIV